VARSLNSHLLYRAHLVQACVDAGDLFHPFLPLGVLHVKHFLVRPVQVIGKICYLLAQPVEGVAGYPPNGTTSVSYVCPQAGHVVWTTF